MFYSVCVFAFGMYVGQEYTDLPRVKNVVASGIEMIKSGNTSNVSKEINGTNFGDFTKRCVDWFANYKPKDE